MAYLSNPHANLLERVRGYWLTHLTKLLQVSAGIDTHLTIPQRLLATFAKNTGFRVLPNTS
jgi:hypothetical protein